MNEKSRNVFALELRIGILEDRLACANVGTEEYRINEQLEILHEELKSARAAYYEFLMATTP